MSVNGEVADDGGEEATSGEIEERIENFKQDKARQKSSFTRIKNKLLPMLDEQDYPSGREIKVMCHQLSDAQERAMETMHRLSMEYALLKDREKRKKVVEEMDKLELEFSEANEKAQEYYVPRKMRYRVWQPKRQKTPVAFELQKAWQRKARNKFEGTKSHYGN